jgi:hypothetical protein
VGKGIVSEQRVLQLPFNIETHKMTFINYLEVVIVEDGTVMYAVPSHQEKLISLACQKLNVTRDELNELCPKEYYFDFMTWLCKVSGCVALWNSHKMGVANERQLEIIKQLSEEKLYHGK